MESKWDVVVINDESFSSGTLLYNFFQIVVVGDGASGKTSICQRFAKESFDKSYHQVGFFFQILFPVISNYQNFT